MAMNGGSGVVSDDEFRAAITPLTDALERWASAWAEQPTASGLVPAADSRAMGEYAVEARHSVSAWLEPARNAFSYADMLSYVLAEHLAAYAAVVLSKVGPAYSHLPTVSALLEAVPIAHWLYDPAIGGLRWPGSDDDLSVRSMRDGLRQYAPGVQMAIRNLATHGAEELAVQPALERLAALSLLVRWVDQCEVVRHRDDEPDRAHG